MSEGSARARVDFRRKDLSAESRFLHLRHPVRTGERARTPRGRKVGGGSRKLTASADTHLFRHVRLTAFGLPRPLVLSDDEGMIVKIRSLTTPD